MFLCRNRRLTLSKSMSFSRSNVAHLWVDPGRSMWVGTRRFVAENDPVVRGDEVPARLGPPRRFRHLAVERRETPRHLRLGHELRERRIDIRRERGGELRLIEEQESVLWRKNWRHRCARRGIRNQLCDRLPLIEGEGSDVDEPYDLRVVPRFRDNRATVRMTDQNHR